MACDHEGCKCDETGVTRGPQAYCSEACAAAAEAPAPAGPGAASDPPEACSCGHPECGASMVASFAKGRKSKAEWF